MDLWESLILGLIQGLTEFLPISSSGHLVLMQYILGLDHDKGITFEIVVHGGTLLSILIYYRSEIAELFKSAFTLLRSPSLIGNFSKQDDGQRLVLFILLSMIPALLVGLFLKSYIETAFESPIWVCFMLLVTGTLLFSTRFIKESSKIITFKHALGMGLAQAIAILPGISRSGSTIAMGQHLGLNRDQSARFSFLMVIPVIAGAMILELKDIGDANEVVDWGVMLAGFVAAAISGYFALSVLIQVVKRYGIHVFAVYCWLVGIIGLWYFLG